MKIKLSHVTKKYDTLTAVSDLSVNIEDGSLVSILGASGCGKTTILNMIAGLIEPTEGKILFDGQDSKTIDVTDRNIGMVFQDYALYPHMTVENNIAFPLKMKKLSKQSRKNRIQEIAKLLNIYDLLNRYPKQLSGGQQQRVAIARALVKNPTVLLLDEPLSNLDRRLRIFLRDEIRTLQKRLGITTIFVTHDQEEAMAISDKILLMKDGCLLQYDTPYHLYHHPTHLYTCKFLSNPMLNLFSGVYENGKYFVELKNHTILLNPGKINHQAKKSTYVKIGIRPDDFQLSTQGIRGKILSVQTLGKNVLLKVSANEKEILTSLDFDTNYQIEQEIILEPKVIHIYGDDEDEI